MASVNHHELVYVVSNDGLKSFVNAIHAIGKIGKELCIDAEAHGLVLRTLNDSHSVMGEFGFGRSFFQSIHVPFKYENESFNCKVFIKTCQTVFRTLKRVERVDIVLALEETDASIANLVFRLHCEQNITKTHCLGISDCQVMRAVFDKENSPNSLASRVYHLSCLLAHIHDTNEILIRLSDTSFQLQSYFPNPDDVRSHIQTQTQVDIEEFNEYQVTVATELVFCLKEVRALLSWCDASDLDQLTMYCSTSGRYSTDMIHQ